jgi:hypothetical protein
MSYTPQKARRVAIGIAVGLLPISAALVNATTDRPLTIDQMALATVIVDDMLCLCLASLCMLLGFARAFLTRNWIGPEPLLGYGAALGVVAIIPLRLFALTHSNAPSDAAQQ